MIPLAVKYMTTAYNINPATYYVGLRASRMARIKARLAGKGDSLGKSRNAETGHS